LVLSNPRSYRYFSAYSVLAFYHWEAFIAKRVRESWETDQNRLMAKILKNILIHNKTQLN
jgi:hypothetical protein